MKLKVLEEFTATDSMLYDVKSRQVSIPSAICDQGTNDATNNIPSPFVLLKK